MTHPPAAVGMSVVEIDTPALLVDLDAFERNVAKMAGFCRNAGVRLRAHAKTHKSPDIAKRQVASGAVGVCCQKVSEAEVLAEGGVGDILVSNEVVGERKIARLAELAGRARIGVCVDDAENLADLDRAAAAAGTTMDVLVEIDVGAARCGVRPGRPAVDLALRTADCAHLSFGGLQAYQGSAQHIRSFTARKRAIDAAIALARETVAGIADAGLVCRTVAGAGTGSYRFEAASDLYNELQCGSYIFMDADYGRIEHEDRSGNDEFENALFVYTTVMSRARSGSAVCDAGLKAHSVDSGMPRVYCRDDLEYTGASDEHGTIDDPSDTLALGEKLRLVPGHCDPTVNLHDWYVGIRAGKVELLWPISARGMVF